MASCEIYDDPAVAYDDTATFYDGTPCRQEEGTITGREPEGVRIGCGDYRVFVQTRGGASQLTELLWSSLSFTRRLDDMSDATITIGMEGLADEDCCQVLADLEPWEHEISIWRDGEEAWVGPVMDPIFFHDQAIITARDLFAWFERRTLRTDRTFTDTDLALIFSAYVDDALAEDNEPNISVAPGLVNIAGTRQILGTERRRAADELRELARSGLDFSLIGRTVLIGGQEVPTPALATLTEETFDAAEGVRLVGLQTATRWDVIGGTTDGGTAPVTGIAGGVDDVLGLIALSAHEPAILDASSVQANADTRLDLSSEAPRLIAGLLTEEAPIAFERLIPGAVVELAMIVGCRDVIGTFRLLDVNVNVNVNDAGITDEVRVTMQSLGTTSAGGS